MAAEAITAATTDHVKRSAQPGASSHIWRRSLTFGIHATGASAAAAISGAGFRVGAADAFDAALFCFVDVADDRADDHRDQGNDNKINHRLTSFR